MLAICIEASHQKGMGHLFRTLNFIHYLKKYAPTEKYIVAVNEDPKAMDILKRSEISYVPVDFDSERNWEKKLIDDYKVTAWINDRLDTETSTVRRVKECKIPVYTIDDRGPGAGDSDINFASLVFDEAEKGKIAGGRVFFGEKYLILNPEIDLYKKQKKSVRKILITMGGSDTYNLTLLAIGGIKKTELDVQVTCVIGPGSKCFAEAKKMSADSEGRIRIKSVVPSLIEEMSRHDLAITAGGVTAFEAAATGLPTISIAAEPHEKEICHRLEELGCSSFLGYWKDVTKEDIAKEINVIMSNPDMLCNMSRNGMEKVDTLGAKRIIEEIEKYD